MSVFILGTDLLKPDSTDLLLAQISVQISDRIEAASLLDAQPLRPSLPAIAVHTLWSLSLNLSLASALRAILVQEWCQIPAIFTVPSSTFNACKDQRLSIQRGVPLSHEESDYHRPTVHVPPLSLSAHTIFVPPCGPSPAPAHKQVVCAKGGLCKQGTVCNR